MVITLFNGLSNLQVRGISKVADELARHLRGQGHTVHEVKIPNALYFKSSLIRLLMLILFQQFVTPVVALKTRSQLIIDPYNGYPAMATFFIRTKYFIHDYTPFYRKLWFLRPATLYQFILLKLDSLVPLAEAYHDALGIETPHFLHRSVTPRVFPLIVDPLDTSESDFFDKYVRDTFTGGGANCLLLTTISGTGWNKDFGGLVDLLRSLKRPFLLVAFGFGERGVEHEEILTQSNLQSHVLTVGFVEEAAIATTIRNSELFVFHSLREGFGRPIIEALQLKKLVITDYAPVVGILSPEAMQNVFVYQTKDEFQRAFEMALARKYIDFSTMYRTGIDNSIEEFLK
jgi:glycosyltransferase involved in cell wall biosynthesis